MLFHISDAGRCIQISVGSKRYKMIVSLSNEINILRGGVDCVLVSFFNFQALAIVHVFIRSGQVLNSDCSIQSPKSSPLHHGTSCFGHRSFLRVITAVNLRI